ncbi:MAG TPA: hypothetical protein VFM93_04710 [Candidatus Limnocylindria bacterium]|nr:hypothetical protein [Candidatus Limnocylindria bacterium]
MTREALVAALDEAGARAAAGGAPSEEVAALLARILTAASATPEVGEALRDVPAGKATLRFTDAPFAFAFEAGQGRLSARAVDPKEKHGPRVDATSATWLGLLGGTLKPWLAFTRGLVIARAGLTELRWLQQVAERLQHGYREARG